MHAKNWQLFILNTLAVLAYVSLVIQWFLMAFPYVPGIIDSHVFQDFFSSDQQVTIQAQPAAAWPGWLAFVIAAVLIGIMLVVVSVTLARLPRAIGTTGQKATNTVAKHVLPVVTHHAKLSKRKQHLLTARIIFDLKLAALVTPVLIVLLAPTPAQTMPLTRELLLFVVALTAGWTLLLFCLQAIIARAFRVPLERLW